MSFLVVMRPAGAGLESEPQVLEAHWAYLRRLHTDSGWLTPEIRPMRIVTR